MTRPSEAVFTVTWQYAAFSLLHYAAASMMLLLPFVADVGTKSGLGASVVLAVAAIGLVALIRRLTQCGIFLDPERLTLRTVTRTTTIPFARLRIDGDKVSYVAQADAVPALTDTAGRTVKAGVLTGINPHEKLAIVRTILHARDVAVSNGAHTVVD